MARILLADDELDMVDVFAEILRDEGHDVRTATDGRDALRTIRAWRPDIAILDVDMPSMSGPSIAVELSKEGHGLERIPVVLLSGNADVERVGAEAGIRYCVTKPVGPDEFMNVLESALAHHDSSPEPINDGAPLGSRRFATRSARLRSPAFTARPRSPSSLAIPRRH